MKSSRLSAIRLLSAFSLLALCVSGCGGDQGSGTSLPTEPQEPAEQAAAAIAPSLPAPAVLTAARSPETVLVKVDDTAITQADLEKETDKMKALMKKSGLSPENMESLMPNMEPQIIEGLVTKALFDNECAKQNVVVSEDDMKAEIESIKTGLPDGASLDKMLEQTGMTQAVFENEIRGQLKIKKLLKVPQPTDEQVKAYYDENKDYFEVPETVRARHILVKVEDTDSDETKTAKKEKAEAIRKELIGGADFAKLAEEKSDCPSGRQGGALGNVRRGQMVKAFEDATFNLKTGEISGVVETQFGYHVIEAIDHKEAKVMQLEEVAPRIKSVLQAEDFQKKAEDILGSLKEKATITYSEGVKRVEK